jgi:hypothetical protein
VVWALDNAKRGNAIFLVVALAMAMFGLIMLPIARRAWLNLEVG